MPALLETLDRAGHAANDMAAMALPPLMQLSSLLPEAAFKEHIVPAVGKLFASPNRQTRLQLLQALPTFVGRLGASLINNTVFTHVASGFADNVPLMREWTVRSMVHFAPFLRTDKIVLMMNYFKRLQAYASLRCLALRWLRACVRHARPSPCQVQPCTPP